MLVVTSLTQPMGEEGVARHILERPHFTIMITTIITTSVYYMVLNWSCRYKTIDLSKVCFRDDIIKFAKSQMLILKCITGDTV